MQVCGAFVWRGGGERRRRAGIGVVQVWAEIGVQRRTAATWKSGRGVSWLAAGDGSSC